MSYKAVYSLIHDMQAKPKSPAKVIKKKRDTWRSICFDLSIPSRRCFRRFGCSAKTNRDLAFCPLSKEESPPVVSNRWQLLKQFVDAVITGERFFLELPRLTGECFQIFIDESATFPNTLNIMVLDNPSSNRWFLTTWADFSATLQSGVESD